MAIPAPDREWLLAQQVREKGRKKPRKLVEEETREIGSVKWKIYDTYLNASGYFTWVIILLLIGITQLSGFFEKYWIKVWGEAYGKETAAVVKHVLVSVLRLDVIDLPGTRESATHSNIHPLHVNPALLEVNTQNLPPPDKHPMFYVAVYGAIGIGGVVITTINTIVQYGGAVRASRLLFTRLLNSLVHATMRWHDKTPTGRILNRLSRDMEVLDSSLSNSLRAVIFRLATFFASIITVAYVFPLFLIPATVISYFYWRISKGYINAGRDMRRMQSTTRSPIFAGFAETLEGIVTVRAFGAERKFLETLLEKIDLTTKMWYGFWMINRWLLLRFDALGALSIFIITLFALSGYISSGWAGITITSAMQFTVSVYWTCRLATQLELDLNSVERVVEYLDLPQEPPGKIEGKEVPAYWPSTATITGDPNQNPLIRVEDLVIRYAPELSPVLTGVSFSLKAGEKVGLLGRTGSGKSTLAMSLLRFVDPSSGRIIIDGVDICSIGLDDLRSRVTIIPQDSVLFSGSLRENLDPFDEHTDSECLDALYRVHLLTPGARVRKHTSSADLRTSSQIGPSILERVLTPEPEGLNTEDAHDGHDTHDKSRSMTSDTLLAPVLDHAGGMVTPNQMGTLGGLSGLGFGSARFRLQNTERDMPNFRFGGGMESGAISPTGAFSPVAATMNPTHTVRFKIDETDSPAPASEPVSRPPEAENGNETEPETTRVHERGSGGSDLGLGRRGAMSINRSRGGSGGISRDGDGETILLNLDTRVASGGANFSSGQRQLVSMARALLRRNAVVILDEATSSIDFETDTKIQQTVREEFRSSCLLTIAHRIRTVIDYDRLIILDKGKIVEFDTPWNLIQKDGGLFRDMCLKSGQMRELEQMAKAQSLHGNQW